MITSRDALRLTGLAALSRLNPAELVDPSDYARAGDSGSGAGDLVCELSVVDSGVLFTGVSR